MFWIKFKIYYTSYKGRTHSWLVHYVYCAWSAFESKLNILKNIISCVGIRHINFNYQRFFFFSNYFTYGSIYYIWIQNQYTDKLNITKKKLFDIMLSTYTLKQPTLRTSLKMISFLNTYHFIVSSFVILSISFWKPSLDKNRILDFII